MIVWKRGTCGGRRITTQKLFSSCAKVVTGTRYSSKTLCNEEPWTLKLKKKKMKLSYKNRHILYDGKCGQVIKTLLKKKYTLFYQHFFTTNLIVLAITGNFICSKMMLIGPNKTISSAKKSPHQTSTQIGTTFWRLFWIFQQQWMMEYFIMSGMFNLDLD